MGVSLFRKTILSLGAIAVVAGLAVALLLPQSPISPLIIGGPPILGDIRDETGTLSAADRVALAAVSAGAAVDYPSPADFFTNRNVPFNYVVPSIENFGYPTGTHGQNRPVAIVLHVAEGTCAGMQSWFATGHWITLPNGNQVYVQASTHFGVCENGSLDQYLEIEDASYGQGVKNGLSQDTIAATFANTNPNLYVVSIEIAGKCADGIFLQDRGVQEATLIMLLGWLRDNLGINLDPYYVIGHFDIDDVNRPNDPLCLFADGEEGFRNWVTSLSTVAPVTIEDRIASLENAVEALIDALNAHLVNDSIVMPPPPAPAPQDCNYTVKSSDWDGLGGIALREIGDITRWPEIATLNGLTSPYIITVGQVLKMPCVL